MMARWGGDDVEVLLALAAALGATALEAGPVTATLLGRHRPGYALGILEQVEATLTVHRMHHPG